MPPKLRPIKKQISLTSQPPQHAYENDPNHRSFLSRSLNKSDTELCAIMKLNSSLSQLKKYIVDEFGNDVLLDVGEGKLTLRKYVLGDDDADSKNNEGGESVEGESNRNKNLKDSEELVFVNMDKERIRMYFELQNDNKDDEIEDENADEDDAGVEEDDSIGTNKGKESNDDDKNKEDQNSVEENKDDGSNDKNDESADDNGDVEMKEGNNEMELSPSSKPSEGQVDQTISAAIKTPEELKYQTLIKTNPKFTPIIKSFILRLKLRRKLLNRLSRRLLRLSYAMDGKLHKINPPMLPKYGTSFEKHSQNVKDKVNEWNMDFESRKDVLQKVWRKKDAWNKVLQMNEKEKMKDEAEKEGRNENDVKIVKSDDTVQKKDDKNDMDIDKYEEIKSQTSETDSTDKSKEEDKKDDKNNDMDVEKDEEKEANSTSADDNEKAMAIEAVEEQINDKNDTENSVETDEIVRAGGGGEAVTPNKSGDDQVKREDDENVKNEDNKLEATSDVSSKKKSEGNINQSDDIKKPDPPTDEEAASEDEPAIPVKTKDDTDIKAAAAEISKLNASPFDFDPFLLDSEYQKNLEKLIEHDMDYAKKHTVHLPTTTILRTTTALTKDELAALDKDEDDFDDTSGSTNNVGAVSKFMTKKEKVVEWKRWQTEFLSKIPDQPTFQEVTNRVFMLDERRSLSKKINEEKKEEGFSSCEKDINKNNKDKSLKRKREDKSGDDEANEDGESVEGKNNVKKINDVEASIMKKRICLDPVPSFHQQDYSRILMIQSATLSAALTNTTREAYIQAKNEYDQIFRRSHAIQQQKNNVEKELHKVVYQFRMKINGINQTISHAKAKWETDKKAFESQRIRRMQVNSQFTGAAPSPDVVEAMRLTDNHLVKRSLTAALDRVTIRTAPKEHSSGSPFIASVLRRATPNSVTEQVATTLAHCVDVVTKRLESRWLVDAVIDEAKGGEQFPPFVPPASTNPDQVIMNERGESYTQLEKRLNKEISQLKTQLDASEASRSKAWSRLNKTKAAFSRSNGGATSTHQSSKTYRPKAIAVTKTNYANPNAGQTYNVQQQRPVISQPHSTGTTSYRPPAALATNPAVASAAVAAAAVRANMNIGNPTIPQGSSSENKYSIDKVRARMYSDGSVLPVSEPKRGKDGLFIRPAGRQRKGMDWDGVNGKWVPQGTLRR